MWKGLPSISMAGPTPSESMKSGRCFDVGKKSRQQTPHASNVVAVDRQRLSIGQEDANQMGAVPQIAAGGDDTIPTESLRLGVSDRDAEE